MRSRFLMECTTPEIDAYLAAGGKTALLPVGCTEMHGPHQPIGTDTLIAKAFALRLAEATDGVVLPTIHYSWAGATDGFAGTISVEQELLRTLLTQIVLKVRRMGFTRIVVLDAALAPEGGLLDGAPLDGQFDGPAQVEHDDARPFGIQCRRAVLYAVR